MGFCCFQTWSLSVALTGYSLYSSGWPQTSRDPSASAFSCWDCRCEDSTVFSSLQPGRPVGRVRRVNFILAVIPSRHLQVDWPGSLLSCCRSNDTEPRAGVDLEMVNWPCSWQAVAGKRNCWKLTIEFSSMRVRKGVWSWAPLESLDLQSSCVGQCRAPDSEPPGALESQN